MVKISAVAIGVVMVSARSSLSVWWVGAKGEGKAGEEKGICKLCEQRRHNCIDDTASEVNGVVLSVTLEGNRVSESPHCGKEMTMPL